MEKVREKVKNIRRDFDYDSLHEKDVPKLPLDLLLQWLDDAIKAEIKEPNAFVLSTVNNAQPDSRVLLLRDAREEGLEFYTNYSSKKGQDLTHNNLVSINFLWVDLGRQVRIHAKVERLATHLSDEYFASRPRESQIGAWASNQSHKLKSRESLEERIAEIEKKFKGEKVPRPDFWGGYLAVPFYYEFWQGRASRLHDRIVYEQEGGDWQIKRLFP